MSHVFWFLVLGGVLFTLIELFGLFFGDRVSDWDYDRTMKRAEEWDDREDLLQAVIEIEEERGGDN